MGNVTVVSTTRTETSRPAARAVGATPHAASASGDKVALIEVDDVGVRGLPGVDGIPTEAPVNGLIYGRKDADWVEVTSGGVGNVVTPQMFGAVGDGVALDGPALKAAMESGASEVWADLTYLVGAAIDAVITAPLTLRINGTIKGAAGADHILRIDAGAGRHRVVVHGSGTVDASLRTNTPSVASGSGLLIRTSDDVRVSGLKFYGGTRGDGFGDSGLIPEYCHRVVIDGCQFDGWDDHDIYATGGADPVTAASEAESLIVTNCTFTNNGAGSVRIARDYKRVIVSDNIAKDVEKLVIVAGGDSNFISAEKLTIANNIVDGAFNVAIDVRYTKAGSGSVISGNQVYDWGKITQGPAINLRGASNVAVTGNVLRPRATPNTVSCATGIYLTDATGDDGAAYAAANCHVAGNIVEVSTGGARINNYGILDRTNGANFIGHNTLLNTAPFDLRVDNLGVDATVGQAQAFRRGPLGVGFGGVIPKGVVDVADTSVVSRSVSPLDTYLKIDRSGANALIASFSPVNSADYLDINATTDAANTVSTGGAAGIRLRTRNVIRVDISETDVQLLANGTGNVAINPIGSGGWNLPHLTIGPYHLWVDSTGAMRIKSGAPTSDLDGALVGGGGGGGGITDAPNDGKPYVRKSAGWDDFTDDMAAAAGTATWTGVSGKPATFPPSTHSHPTSEVTGLDTALTGKAALAGATFTGKVTVKAGDASGAGFNIPSGTPTGPVQGDIWLIASTMTYRGASASFSFANLEGPQTFSSTKTFSVSPVLPTPAAGDNSTKGATTAYADAAVAAKIANKITVASSAPSSPATNDLWVDTT